MAAMTYALLESGEIAEVSTAVAANQIASFECSILERLACEKRRRFTRRLSPEQPGLRVLKVAMTKQPGSQAIDDSARRPSATTCLSVARDVELFRRNISL